MSLCVTSAGGLGCWHRVSLDATLRGMIHLNEPQVWTLIGVFTASMFGLITLVSTLFLSVINAKFERVDAKFERLEAKFDAKFDNLDDKFNHLDRDIRTLFRRAFPEYPEVS